MFLEMLKKKVIKFAKKMGREDLIPDIESAVSPNEIIGIAIAILIMAAILPSALTEFFEANTSTWDSATVIMWGLIPIIVIAVIVLRWYQKK